MGYWWIPGMESQPSRLLRLVCRALSADNLLCARNDGGWHKSILCMIENLLGILSGPGALLIVGEKIGQPQPLRETKAVGMSEQQILLPDLCRGLIVVDDQRVVEALNQQRIGKIFAVH